MKAQARTQSLSGRSNLLLTPGARVLNASSCWTIDPPEGNNNPGRVTTKPDSLLKVENTTWKVSPALLGQATCSHPEASRLTVSGLVWFTSLHHFLCLRLFMCHLGYRVGEVDGNDLLPRWEEVWRKKSGAVRERQEKFHIEVSQSHDSNTRANCWKIIVHVSLQRFNVLLCRTSLLFNAVYFLNAPRW